MFNPYIWLCLAIIAVLYILGDGKEGEDDW